MRETISVSIPPEVLEQLDAAAEASGKSRSEVVREALADYLFVTEFRRLRGEMMQRAEARGVYTDEDVFKLVS